ncbi:membrane protease subunit HflC [Lachnospiraceae bacterium KH1T2]|nr:membrane protease subunit HflC [Lachnospiraceae bacterium KH1T2]
MLNKIRVAIILILVVGIVVVGNSLYTVTNDRYAVVRQFGKIVNVTDAAGLYMKVPFIQEVTEVPRNIQLYDIAPSDVITMDKKSMIADDYVMWKVVDPTKFVKSLNGSITSAQDRVSVAAYNATKNIISSMSQDGIIEARGEKLTNMITDSANSYVGNYGISINKAVIKVLDLPDDNKSAVYDRMISERQNIAAAYKAEGEADAQKIKNETDKEVAIKKAEANKQAEVIKAEGEAEYMKTLQDAYNTPEKADFYNFTRSLDALEKSLKSGNKTVILDKDSPLVQVLYGQGLR